MEKTSTFSNGLLWFGAAVSIAEIMTGTIIAPLGMQQGILAIIIGHLIGVALLCLSGYIGGKTGYAAIESSGISFGKRGSYIFAVLNIIQLVGWTAIMILSGAEILANLVPGGSMLWCVIIGAMILLWILIGIKNLGKLNVFAVGGLFALTVVLSFIVFKGTGISLGGEAGGITFGGAVELSVAMPLSWLPLVSDYTRYAEKPKAATIASGIAYFIGSCWMYIIGMGAAIYAGTGDIAQILQTAGMGVVGVIIVLMSTVTTTFLDAYSGGVSATNLTSKLSEKWAAIIVTILGTAIAILTPISRFEDFLYLIGSFFAPMIAILITDFFVLKKSEIQESFHVSNTIIWIIGVIFYRLLMNLDTPVGYTLPIMLGIGIIVVLTDGVKKKCLKKS